MPMFRKKPVVIEARYFDGTHHAADHLIEWMGRVGRYIPEDGSVRGRLYVGTLEDGEDGEAKHVASRGDWIIRGVKGEFYPCKPDIFEATYTRLPGDARADTALAAKPGMVSEEPTMWAEVVGNYEGDGVEWSCHAISDMDSEERPLLELAADTFEVGTIVKIFEPTPAKSEKEEGV